jgi:hypothetical protein
VKQRTLYKNIQNKEDNTRYESKVEQTYGKPYKNPRNKKFFWSTKDTVEGHSSRLEQV